MCHNVHATTVKAFRELLLLLQTKGDIWGVITATSVTCFLHRNTLKGKGAEGEKKGKEKKNNTKNTEHSSPHWQDSHLAEGSILQLCGKGYFWGQEIKSTIAQFIQSAFLTTE